MQHGPCCGFLPYLQVSIDQVEDEDPRHADKELRGGTEVAQVDAQHPQLFHRLDVGGHDLVGRGDGDGEVLPSAVVADQAKLADAAHGLRGGWGLGV